MNGGFKAFKDIDWSKLTTPQGVTRETIERDYQNAAEDLKKINQEFERYFSNKRKKARVQMLTDNIFRAVNDNVFFHTNGMIDVQGLLKFVTNDDRNLFSDVCKFVYQLYADKPMNNWRLSQFKGLLTYYLCCAGF